MHKTDHWHFEVIEKEKGGFAASCLNFRVFLEAEDLEELQYQITQSIEQKVSQEKVKSPKPSEVKLIFYSN